MAVIPRPIRFGRNSLMDLYPMRETVLRIKETTCLIAGSLILPFAILAETESLLAESFSRMPRLSEADARRSENRRHDIEDRLHELRELIGEQPYDLNSIESKG